MASRSEMQRKSTKYGPTGTCRRNLKPPICLLRSRDQTRLSVSVMLLRRCRARSVSGEGTGLGSASHGVLASHGVKEWPLGTPFRPVPPHPALRADLPTRWGGDSLPLLLNGSDYRADPALIARHVRDCGGPRHDAAHGRPADPIQPAVCR